MKTVRLSQPVSNPSAWSSDSRRSHQSVRTPATIPNTSGHSTTNSNTNHRGIPELAAGVWGGSTAQAVPVATIAVAANRSNLPASHAEMDAYAQSVLETYASQEGAAAPDASLGSYVTQSLRLSGVTYANYSSDNMALDLDMLRCLNEYEGLVELLQEHCNLSVDTAEHALLSIAWVLQQGHVPVAVFGQGSGLSSMGTLMTALPVSVAQQGPHADFLPHPHQPVTSPINANNLLPVDLLEDLPVSMGYQQYQQQYESHHGAAIPLGGQQQGLEDEAFPPLAAASSLSSASLKKSSSSTAIAAQSKKMASARSTNDNSKAATDLAASLFRPARPRQSSMDETSVSPKMSSTAEITIPSIPGYVPAPAYYGQQQKQLEHPQQDHQFESYQLTPDQFSQSVDIVLSMNADLSEAAALEAVAMAQADVSVAHFLVESALRAPPICRHLLNSGCYRRDCQFSHDVAGHTCIFWLRGRCGKGSGCRFLHGFNPELLKDVTVQATVPTSSSDMASYHPEMSDVSSPQGDMRYSSTPLGGATGFGGMGVFPGSSTSPVAPQFSPAYGMGSYPPGLAGSSPAAAAWSSPHHSSRTNAPSSFANIASQGFDAQSSFGHSSSFGSSGGNTNNRQVGVVKIPQDLWNPHENRDSSVFYIADPMERYQQVTRTSVRRDDVIDLHFQSVKTFAVVLTRVLPEKLSQLEQVWIVTGTGHHVGSKTHQKSGGALESALVTWLQEEGYTFYRGRDRNGQGGALMVTR